MSDKLYEDVYSLISSIQQNNDTDTFISDILDFISNVADADGYFFYKITPAKYINLEYINIKSLRLNIKGTSCDKFYTPVHLSDAKSKKIKQPAELCAVTNDILNTPNIYNEKLIDTSSLKYFDLNNDYNCVSSLVFPLFDSNKNTISVVQLINAQNTSGKIINFSKTIQEKVISICQLIAVLLERQQQNKIYDNFLESLVSTLTKIMLSKSPNISAINNKVPLIAQKLAIALSTTNSSDFKNFEMTDEQWNLLNITSWIYDCGKIMTPDYVLNKSSKLETVNNRIHEIRNRFEILRRDAHIEYLQKRLNNIADKNTLQKEFVSKVKKLHDDFEFVGMCNKDDFNLSSEDLNRLDEIASQTFTRYFDRTVGLSSKELQSIDKKASSNPEIEQLLQDRPEQLLTEYNKGELNNLKTTNGMLNSTEKSNIEKFILSTSDILSSIPFPAKYFDIPDIIRIYEQLLMGNNTSQNSTSQTTIMAKIIHLATIFASLSAKNTPFFKPKKLSEIMKIMQKMKNNGLLDDYLYNIFVKKGLYIDCAKDFLDASQIDEINIEEII